MVQVRAPLVALTVVVGVLAAPPGAQAAPGEREAVALAKRSFAVLRTPAHRDDRVPGLRAKGLLVRRVANVDGRRLWLGVDGRRLCLWLRPGRAAHAITTCVTVSRAVRPATPLALLYRGSAARLTAAVALTDGSSHARLHTRGGAIVDLRIRHSALVRVAPPGGSLIWAAPDGSEHELELLRA